MTELTSLKRFRSLPVVSRRFVDQTRQYRSYSNALKLVSKHSSISYIAYTPRVLDRFDTLVDSGVYNSDQAERDPVRYSKVICTVFFLRVLIYVIHITLGTRETAISYLWLIGEFIITFTVIVDACKTKRNFICRCWDIEEEESAIHVRKKLCLWRFVFLMCCLFAISSVYTRVFDAYYSDSKGWVTMDLFLVTIFYGVFMDYQEYLLMIRHFLIDPKYVCKETYTAIGPDPGFSKNLKNIIRSSSAKPSPTNSGNPSATKPATQVEELVPSPPENKQRNLNPMHATFPIAILCITFLLMISLAITRPLTDTDENDSVVKGDAFDALEILQLIEMCLLHFFCCLLLICYWEYFAWYIEQSDVFIALFYLTIIGGVLLGLVRYLKNIHESLDDEEDPGNPTPRTAIKKKLEGNDDAHEKHWAMRRQGFLVVDIMIKIVVVGCVAVVFVGSIAVASFAELSNSMQNLDVWIVFIAFMLLSHLVMVNPFLSASVLDACGGYILTQCLMTAGWTFVESILLIICVITGLHFSGSCAQWVMGSWPSVRLWLNKSAPVLLLTASDSVYKGAGIWKAGLVGGIFPDTINGLNQGRMGMNCWVQFWSEWSALPNATALTVAGALLGSNDGNAVAVLPLVGIVAILMNIVQGLYALSVFNAAVSNEDFWTAYEKWAIVHHFMGEGYIPTLKGWEEDVYHLKKEMSESVTALSSQGSLKLPNWSSTSATNPISDEPPEMADWSSFGLEMKEMQEDTRPLYEKIAYVYLARKKFIEEKRDSMSPRERATSAYKYDLYGEMVRLLHYNYFNEERLQDLASKGLLIYDAKMASDKVQENYFSWGMSDWWGYKANLQRVVFLSLLFTAGISYLLLRVQDFDAVKDGFASMQNTEYWWVGIVAFVIHLLIATFYWHQTIFSFCESSYRSYCGREKKEQVDYSKVETAFTTPTWSLKSLKTLTEISFDFKDDKIESWGLDFDITFNGHNMQWIVINVEEGQGMENEIKEDYKILSINNIEAIYQNKEKIKDLLENKPACTIKFDPEVAAIEEGLNQIQKSSILMMGSSDPPQSLALSAAGDLTSANSQAVVLQELPI